MPNILRIGMMFGSGCHVRTRLTSWFLLQPQAHGSDGFFSWPELWHGTFSNSYDDRLFPLFSPFLGSLMSPDSEPKNHKNLYPAGTLILAMGRRTLGFCSRIVKRFGAGLPAARPGRASIGRADTTRLHGGEIHGDGGHGLQSTRDNGTKMCLRVGPYRAPGSATQMAPSKEV